MGTNKSGLKTLNRVALDARVCEVWADSDGLWLSLAPGWNFEGCSALREDTAAKMLASFRRIEKGEPS